jgi:chromosome segregation ATPase
LQQEISELKEQLATQQSNFKKECEGLESQLTTLAVSTGLLTQQVENLTNQLTESEQLAEKNRLESEIRSNLIREQGDKITQQEQQITSYQNLLRTSEENLSNCQKIILQKSEQLEQLDKEKNLIAEELELANGRIKELEQALLSANSKIRELEARIKELQKNDTNSEELSKLRQELSNQKSKSQSEITRLKSELNQTKLREEALAEKIKELGKKPVKVQETVETSFWETIKTPLYYTLGIILVIMVLG